MVLSAPITFNVSTLSGAASASSAPTCSALRLTGQTSISSRPGGTTVRVALTSHRFPTCTWSKLTGFQFLTSSGRGAGPVERATVSKGAALPRPLRDTFQVIDNVVTMEGVHCSSVVASFLQVVTPDKTNVKIALSRPIGVCVGGKTRWTSVAPPMFPTPAQCATPMIRLSIGPANGAAGTTYLPLRFTNVGPSPCTVAGIPFVQPLSGVTSASHDAVGPRSRSLDFSSNGNGGPIRLGPGDIASAPLGVVETGNYTPSQCRPKMARSLRVRLTNGASWWIRATFSVCTGLASTAISGVVPTIDGVAPLS